MVRSLETIFCVLVFALPCSMGAALMWPLLLHRQISSRFDSDMLMLALISTLGGILITLVMGTPSGNGQATPRTRR